LQLNAHGLAAHACTLKLVKDIENDLDRVLMMQITTIIAADADLANILTTSRINLQDSARRTDPNHFEFRPSHPHHTLDHQVLLSTDTENEFLQSRVGQQILRSSKRG